MTGIDHAAPARKGRPPGPRLFSPTLAVLAGVGLAVSVLVAPEGLPGFDVCWFRRLTDLPCPACGLTRACCAIGHGRFAEAWRLHPFGFVFYAIGLVLAAGPLIRRRWPGLEAWLLARRILVWGPLGLFFTLYAYGIWRLAAA